MFKIKNKGRIRKLELCSIKQVEKEAEKLAKSGLKDDIKLLIYWKGEIRKRK